MPKAIDQLGALAMLVLLRDLKVKEELILERFSKNFAYIFALK